MIFVLFNLLITLLRTKQNIWSQRVYLNYYKIFFYFFFTIYKNEGKEHKFQRQKKSDFYKNKKAFQIDYIDVNKILVSKKEPYDTKNSLKYFSGYNDNNVIRP